MEKVKKYLKIVLDNINRFSHWIDVVIFYFLADHLNNTIQNTFIFLVWILPIWQIYRNIKWEWNIWKSRGIIKETAQNKRVQGFAGSQGAGKTSFMLYCSYVLKCPVFSNFPAKVRGKYTNILDEKVLQMEERIPETSLLLIDEATMLFHNLVLDVRNDKTVSKLYAQQLQQQIVRHCYDGNMFYSSVDITRLPQMLKDNIGLTNYVLGQGNITLSLVTGTVLGAIGSFFGIKLYNSVRYWDIQQLEKIPEQGYTFDLSRQEKNTDTKNYANLIRFCSWTSKNRFEYDDRFLHGIYKQLPEHVLKEWQSLEFDANLLKQIGYGHILDFFANRVIKRK